MHLANVSIVFIALVVSATALTLDIPEERRNGNVFLTAVGVPFDSFCTV